MLKLLIVKTSSLGDVVHNLPIINDIRSHYPDAEIDWMVEENFADVPRLHPAVNHVIPVAIRRWRRSLFSRQTWLEISNLKRQLAAQSYGIVLDTQGLLKSAVLANLSHGRKHGYDKNSAREPLASCFYNENHSVSRKLHAVERNRALAALALGYPIPNNLPDYGIQAPLLADLQHETPYIIGLHGTSRDSKLWPAAYWISLGQELAKLHLHLALPWASAAELERAQHIAGKLGNATVLPRQNISQMAAVISKAQAAIGVDTGLSHLSVALGIPTIAIYTDTNPVLTGVFAGAKAPAINLGNINQSPPPQQVLENLKKII